MQTQIENWLNTYKQNCERNTKALWPNCEANHNTIEWSIGPKYIKVISVPLKGLGRSVVCFIDKVTGDIYKANSWTKPSKYIRGNVSTIDSTYFTNNSGWTYAHGRNYYEAELKQKGI